MAATTFTHEFQAAVAPEKIFKSVVVDASKTLPKVMSNIIKSIERESGSIVKITYTNGVQSKIKIDAVDSQNRICKFTVIEGNKLVDHKVESISYEIKFEPSCNGGSTIKVNGAGCPKRGSNCVADITAIKANMHKAVEEHALIYSASICA